MDKSAIKNFAIQARKDLIAGVKQKAYEYAIDEKTSGNEAPSGALLNGRLLTPEEQTQRNELLNLIKTKGYDQVMEEVAYTWFNRFIALRFMEANDYLPSRIRVFTNEKNEFQPEILSEALHLELVGLNKAKVISLLEANQTEELYKYLLITQCNDLNSALPEMFEKIQNYTELLFPNNLLKAGSVLSNMVFGIPQDDWKEAVEIIGWLYQYYNTEVKEETFALLSKNVKITKERIPAATQLFTPDWIVRYMVENSLGRLWIEGHPSESLKSNWKYYLDEAEQEPEVVAQLEKMRTEYAKIKPEEIKVIDPCMGSGHILVYAFDVLMQIYVAAGYSERDAAKSILQNNLFGLDIDDRAYQLAYFAVMMKARKYCRTIFSCDIHPNLYPIQESNFVTTELINFVADGDTSIKFDLQAVVETLHDAKNFGSILNIPKVDFKKLFNRLEEIQINQMKDLQQLALRKIVIELLIPLVHQAKFLTRKYDVVITNPPYMGSKQGMNNELKKYISDYYETSKSDLFAVFMDVGFRLAKQNGMVGMINQHSWMFLTSFSQLREHVATKKTIINLLHLGPRSFEEIGGEVVQSAAFVLLNYHINLNGKYIRLVDTKDAIGKQKVALSTIAGHNNSLMYQFSMDNFAKLPDKIIGYWISKKIIKIFEHEKCLTEIAKPRQGLSTSDNDRFLRFWFEPEIINIGFSYDSRKSAQSSGKKWFPYNKGGEFRKWYGNNNYVINWEDDGRELREWADWLNTHGTSMGRLVSQEFYFQKGITWSGVGATRFGVRCYPQGMLFDVGANGIFVSERLYYYLTGFLNSKLADEMLKILNPTINTGSGTVGKLPIIINQELLININSIVENSVELTKLDWDSFEASWDYLVHPLLTQIKCNYIGEAYNIWQCLAKNRFDQLKSNEEELNRIFITIYGLQDDYTPEVDDNDVSVRMPDLCREIRSLLSYVIGVIFGRYSLDVEGLAYAGGEWDDNKFSSVIPDKDNILPISEDMYFEDDIVTKLVGFLKVVFGEEALEENLQFIADALGNRGDSSREVIRNYFLNDFYKDHLKIYQKRPIYWLFDSGKKNGFKALIYMHRYQPDLLATMRTDYVHEQQERYRTQLQHLEASVMHASPADLVKINKQIGKLKEQSLELLAYEEKIHHLADQMIDINLDDGVKVNYAKFEDVLAPIK